MEHHADVDTYLEHAGSWPDEIRAIRPILLDCGLTEEIKWGKPCYSSDGANIVILQEMKDFLALMFFKGALLSDLANVLEEQGPNSRSARRMTFTSVDEVEARAGTIATYVDEAIEVEAAGLEVPPAPDDGFVEELQRRLDEDPEFETAFRSLTPGRQREYNLHFGGAKQAATRESRIDKCAPKILAGKGFRDR